MLNKKVTLLSLLFGSPLMFAKHNGEHAAAKHGDERCVGEGFTVQAGVLHQLEAGKWQDDDKHYSVEVNTLYGARDNVGLNAALGYGWKWQDDFFVGLEAGGQFVFGKHKVSTTSDGSAVVESNDFKNPWGFYGELQLGYYFAPNALGYVGGHVTGKRFESHAMENYGDNSGSVVESKKTLWGGGPSVGMRVSWDEDNNWGLDMSYRVSFFETWNHADPAGGANKNILKSRQALFSLNLFYSFDLWD